MILRPASDFDFAKARKAFRKQGMYIKHMPSGRIKVFLRPGYTINDIISLSSPRKARNAKSVDREGL